MPFAYLLPVWIVLTAGLHIRAEYSGPRWQVYLFKPLTTVLILLLAASETAPVSERYQWLIELGLICSLAGDVFLMLPKDRFIPGLVSFLLAHLFYIAAFHEGIAWLSAPVILLPFLVALVALLRILWPTLGGMKLPVFIYAVVIAAMAWQATERWMQLGDARALWALAGAVWFMVSDSVLAYNRFVHSFRSAQAVILVTYYLAQYLIARSI